MTQTITMPRLFRKLSRSMWVLAFLGIFVFVGLVVLLALPEQLRHGEKGQFAIQALDAMRPPFLDIKRLEARMLSGAEVHGVRLDFEDAAASGHAALASYQHLAQYNGELAMNVAELAQHYEHWEAVERKLYEQLSSPSDAAGPASEKRLRESLYLTTSHFLHLMDILGDGEKPIHADIDRGRDATHRLLSLSAILLLYLASLLFFGSSGNRVGKTSDKNA